MSVIWVLWGILWLTAFIEVMKYCTGRHFNIDNIIFNIIGAIVGYYIYRLVEKINFINLNK